MGIKIRTTKLSDIDQLERVERQSYWSGYSHWKADTFLEYLRHVNTIAIVACEGKVLVGKAMGMTYKRSGVVRFDIHDVSVLPVYRGIGIGKRLLKTLEHRAIKFNSVSSSLYVRFNNHKAFCLYRQLGYVPIPRGNRWGLRRMVKHFPQQGSL